MKYLALVILLLAKSTHALVLTELPSNAYINFNGFDWAWASPLRNADFTYQAQFGWRAPTAQELQQAPLATDFLFEGANATFTQRQESLFSDTEPMFNFDPLESFPVGGTGACAASWFSAYSVCNWGNGKGQQGNLDWSGPNNTLIFLEALAIRVPSGGGDGNGDQGDNGGSNGGDDQNDDGGSNDGGGPIGGGGDPVAVSEPGTLSLFGIGSMILLMMRKRRHQA